MARAAAVGAVLHAPAARAPVGPAAGALATGTSLTVGPMRAPRARTPPLPFEAALLTPAGARASWAVGRSRRVLTLRRSARRASIALRILGVPRIAAVLAL
jgi:hypothetical protein